MKSFYILIRIISKLMSFALIRICQAAHAAHYTEDIVICGIDTDLSIAGSGGGRCEGELKGRVIDTRHITGARRLVLFGFEAERVDIDACGGDVGMVLIRLYKIEVTTHALRETIMTVKLELSGEDGIEANINTGDDDVVLCARRSGVGVREEFVTNGGERSLTRRIGNNCRRHITVGRCGCASGPGGVNGISVIEPLFAEDGSHSGGVYNRIFLDDPDKLFAGMIEVKLDLVRDRGDRLVTSELNLLDEVLVRDLREAATLISVKEDVVGVERRGLERGDNYSVTRREVAIGSGTELKIDLDLVVLESNKGKGKAGIAAEPELKRDVKIHLGDEGSRNRRGSELGKGRYVTDHVLVTNLLALSLGKLVPDVHPVTVVLVDALATNFDLGVLDKIVAEVIEPTELLTGRDRDLRDCDLKVYTREKITITRNSACHALAEVSRAVEGLLDGFHREVRVASVNNFEESNLRIAGKVYILRAIRDELH